MNAPLSKELSREEFNKLNVEQQLEYTHQLMRELHQRLLETRLQLEQAKKTISSIEQKNGFSGSG